MTVEQVARASSDVFMSPAMKNFAGEDIFSICFRDADGLGQTRYSNYWGAFGPKGNPTSISSLKGVVSATEFGMTEMRMGHVFFKNVRSI
jgi:hypothetical protein